MPQRLTVVVSQGQSQNPAKRSLEEDIVGGLLGEPGIDVTVIPNLYDLQPDGTGVLCLQGITGDMVVAAWLFPRAIRWTLDRHGVHGEEGTTLLVEQDDEDEEDQLDAKQTDEEEDSKERVIDGRQIPDRRIYCLDLRSSNSPATYLEEIRRIAGESTTTVVQLSNLTHDAPTSGISAGGAPPNHVNEDPGRRWYPVIDYSRCTNCMECIDFCLFGVYGVDNIDTILVEQPDNCRKGCPACSRVCPENAIIFPQHRTPGIAGSAEAVGGLKIDLSKLFGQPDEDPLKTAARERDEQLVLAGRDTVGLSVGMPKRQEGKPQGPKDDLDNLMDQVDILDL